MKIIAILLLFISSTYSSEQNKPKIYTLNEYQKVNSITLNKYANDDVYWGIKLHDLALLSSANLNLSLDRDYYKKCTVRVDVTEYKISLENLMKNSLFLARDGIREEESSPTEVVIDNNRALISYSGSDDGGFWVTVKLIVKLNKQLDIYTIHGWTGDTEAVEIPNKDH